MSTNQPEPTKRLAYPFKKKAAAEGDAPAAVTDPQTYHDALAKAEDGFYPIGINGQWHGGIHFGEQTGQSLEQDAGIHCIADGEVIAYRIDSQYPKVTYPSCADATYSTGFVLVRHRLQAPPIPTSTSTAPTAATNENDDAPPSLLIYSLYMHLLDWAGYQADSTKPRPDVWGKPVFAVAEKANDSRRNHANNPHIPEGGIGTNLRDAAGSYAGFAPRGTQLRLGAASTRRGYFPVEQVVSGQTIPHDIVGALAYKAELTPSTPDPQTDRVVVLDEPAPIAAGDLVGHLGQYQRFIDVNPMSANCRDRSLSHLEVFTGDDVDAFLTESRAHAARLPDAQKTLLRIDTGAKLTPPPRAKQAPSIQGADGIEVTYPVIVNLRTLKEVHKEEDGTRWFEVTAPAENGQRSGWIREKDHPGISRHHPWEWPEFERIQPDSHAPATLYALHVTQHQMAGADERDRIQSQGEPARSGPLYQRLYEHLDQDNDKKLTESELRAGLKKPHLAQALARLIVTHDSEWAGPMSKWDGVDELIPQDRKADWEKEKERIKSLLLWDELKGKHGFPSDTQVHHLHPIGLVENFASFQRCISLKEAQEVALRVSGGYEGRADLDYHALADDFDGQGTSFGLIQWNFGQNTLGPLLLQMYNRDPEAFSGSFPDNSDYTTLETAIRDQNQQDQLNWARSILQRNRTGWAQAFNNLGDIPAFQEIQLNAALDYHANVMSGIRLMREIAPDLMEEVHVGTYVALYDLSVQQGSIARGGSLENIRQRYTNEQPTSQVDFLEIVVQERARTASSRWRADAMSRRMGIIQRSPYTASESGQVATRSNANFHLLEEIHDKPICNI